MKVSMDKKYKTRDGRDVRIFCTDVKRDYPVLGLVDCGDHEDSEMWTSEGKCWLEEEGDSDYVEIAQKRLSQKVLFPLAEQQEGWG